MIYEYGIDFCVLRFIRRDKIQTRVQHLPATWIYPDGLVNCRKLSFIGDSYWFGAEQIPSVKLLRQGSLNLKNDLNTHLGWYNRAPAQKHKKRINNQGLVDRTVMLTAAVSKPPTSKPPVLFKFHFSRTQLGWYHLQVTAVVKYPCSSNLLQEYVIQYHEIRSFTSVSFWLASLLMSAVYWIRFL